MKKCPYCAELIQNEAVLCRYCKRDLNVDIVEGVYTRVKPHRHALRFYWILIVSIIICISGVVSFLWSTLFFQNQQTLAKQEPTILPPLAVLKPTSTIVRTAVTGPTIQKLISLFSDYGIPHTTELTNNINTIKAQSDDNTLVAALQFKGDKFFSSRLEMKLISDVTTNRRNYLVFNQYYPILLADWPDRDQWINQAGYDNNQKLKSGQDPAISATTYGDLVITLEASKNIPNLILIIERK